MFQFLFRYPAPVFSKGQFVLLGAAPRWLLWLLIVVATAALAVAVWWRLHSGDPDAVAPKLRGWRAWSLWAMQAVPVALLFILLWQPAVRVSELNSQQNIIAVVLDDSRSMAIPDSNGSTREAAAISALQSGVLAGLAKRFQVRLYRLDAGLTRIEPEARFDATTPIAPATHIADGLQQLATETSDLPVGAVVLLSDGGENTSGPGGSGIALPALDALRNRRLPVHTVGFGADQPPHDVEMQDASIPASGVANARIAATATWTQHGFAGQHATLTVRDNDKLIAAREVTLAADAIAQTEPVFFPAGAAGAKLLHVGIQPLAGEANTANNALTRTLLVSDTKRRILYIEGEPRWEFKFIRRAEDSDPTVQVVSMLRTSENKVYRQGINGPGELADGFPTRAEDLFAYNGIIIGSVDADFFTPLQQELLREYVDRRGGGILFLGGRSSLSDGGWAASSLNELLPTFLPSGRASFHRNAATVELTSAGIDSPITRLLDDTAKNAERWRRFTYLADYEDPGSPKPGATVLINMNAGHRRLPLLVTQPYGHGRSAILATGGTWRWQMSEALGDPSHDLFWQQLLRWLIADTPGAVTAATSERTLLDQGHVQLTAQVHDKDFQPASDAHVTAHISGPTNALVDLTPAPDTPGVYRADWTAEKPGAYLAEVTAENSAQQLGSAVLTFQREDGVAENFHTEQNRALLDQLATQTGGRYWKPTELADLPRDISYSEAGISIRSTKELWNMPVVFLVLLGLPVTEWLLRRKWGVV